MTTQLCSPRRVGIFRAGISAIALLLVLIVRERADATPVFPQVYGTTCQAQMPMLNAFGGYTLADDRAAVLPEVNGAGQGRLPNVDVDVGVHNNALDNGKTLLQTAYLGNATGVSPFGEAYDYSHTTDRPSQWRVVHADPAKPYEVGEFGEIGALGFTESALIPSVRVDKDNVVTPDIRKDPRPGLPSYLCGYATATASNPRYLSPHVASNPIQPAGSTGSSWMIGSTHQMVGHEHDHGTVNFTYYQTNQALGESGVRRLIPTTGVQTSGGPGFSYTIDPYTRFYTTVYLQNQRPALSILMRFKPPLWSHLK